MNYFSPVHGGSAEVPYRLAKELAERGHDISIYTTDYKINHEWLESAEELHIKVRGFKTWLNVASFQVTPGMVSISREIKSFDLIHMHNYRTFQNIVIYQYAKKYGIPFILQAHGSLPRIMTKHRLKQIYDKLWGYKLLDGASKVIANTISEFEQYKHMGVLEDKITIIPNGIDLCEYENLPPNGNFRKKWNIRDDQKIILFLARIHKIKGPDLLARAFTKISKNKNDLKLVFVGPDGGYLPFMKRLISELRIEENVLFTGPLYGRDKLEAYVDADVYVLPSVYETFPISVIEACACGTPVIVTDRCGMANIIDGQVGLVVPYDEDALGIGILDILSDVKKRQEYVKKGKLLVRDKLNWVKIVEQIEAVYRNCLITNFQLLENKYEKKKP